MSSWNEGGVPIEKSRNNLIKKWVYIAEVSNFTFQFANIGQVQECLDYFEKNVHPSTIGSHPPYEHYWQPWCCKLPKGLKNRANRQKVIKALNQIMAKWVG